MTDTRSEFEDLASLYFAIGIAVAVLVFALVLFVAVRYRRRDDELPRQREGSPKVEIGYAVLLACVAAVLVAFTFRTQGRVDGLAADPGLRVDVTAAKWNWRFDYPREGVSQVGSDSRPTTLVVPTGTAVRFRLTSRDVIHAFWIPYLRFKRDAFPKRTTEFDLVFDRAGLHTSGRCAEFCGLKHSQMEFNVRALTPADFDAWARERRRE